MSILGLARRIVARPSPHRLMSPAGISLDGLLASSAASVSPGISQYSLFALICQLTTLHEVCALYILRRSKVFSSALNLRRVARLISFTISFAMNRSPFRLPTATIPNPNRLRQPADLYLS